MNALILSAGLGTRFLPTTEKIAKPCIPFFNVPLMAYSLYYLEQLGLKNLTFNTHHLPKNVMSVAECLTYQKNYEVHFSHEDTILGSGGGIRLAEKFLVSDDISVHASPLSHDFIVCNGDEVILFDHSSGFKPLLELHRSQNALATFLTTDHPLAGKKIGGIWTDSSGRVRKLGGISDEPGAKHFTGVAIYSNRVFDYMPPEGEFHIFRDCLNHALAKGETILALHDTQLTWLDMSSEKDYIASCKIAAEILPGGCGGRAGRDRASCDEGTSALATCSAPASIAFLEKYENAADYSPLAKSENFKNILRRFHQNFLPSGPHMFLCEGAKFTGTLKDDAFLFMGPESEIAQDVEVRGFAILGARAKFIQGVIENAVIAPNVHIHNISAIRNEIVV